MELKLETITGFSRTLGELDGENQDSSDSKEQTDQMQVLAVSNKLLLIQLFDLIQIQLNF
jgi:hypothetical protein